MCCYKLVRVDFKVWGLQGKTENLITQNQEKLFLKTHGQVFAQLDKYFDMSMDDIRVLENAAQKELDELKKVASENDKQAKNEKKPATTS